MRKSSSLFFSERTFENHIPRLVFLAADGGEGSGGETMVTGEACTAGCSEELVLEFTTRLCSDGNKSSAKGGSWHAAQSHSDDDEERRRYDAKDTSSHFRCSQKSQPSH